MPYCTGVGSRKAPAWALRAGENIARHLNKTYTFRHGDADGMDTAFSKGANSNEEIWVPVKNFNAKRRHSNNPQNLLSTLMFNVAGNWLVSNHIVSYFWHIRDEFTKQAFARNVYQVLGKTNGARVENGVYLLNYELSEFLVYWATLDKRNNVEGGTRVAVGAAKVLGIPTYNLNVKSEAEAFCKRYNIPYRYYNDMLFIDDPMATPTKINNEKYCYE